jgi:hypothetical protein
MIATFADPAATAGPKNARLTQAGAATLVTAMGAKGELLYNISVLGKDLTVDLLWYSISIGTKYPINKSRATFDETLNALVANGDVELL